jgi:hypothetical protein
MPERLQIAPTIRSDKYLLKSTVKHTDIVFLCILVLFERALASAQNPLTLIWQSQAKS